MDRAISGAKSIVGWFSTGRKKNRGIIERVENQQRDHFKNKQYKKPHRDACLIVEYTVLSLLFVLFCGFLYCSFFKWSLCWFSALSIISLFFFLPVLNHPTIDLAPLIALSAHFFTLLWIGLVFVAINPSSFAAVPAV